MSRRPRDTASARSHTNLPLATVHTRLRQLATAFAFAIALAIASAATFAFAFATFTILAPIAPGTAVTAAQLFLNVAARRRQDFPDRRATPRLRHWAAAGLTATSARPPELTPH